MKLKKQYWFRLAFQLRGSVIPVIYRRVICMGLFGFLISVLYYFNFPVSHLILGSVIPSIVLGLLLVFRTNTAYERFWEGRKLWGNLVSDTRNMAWQIWVMIGEIEPEDRAKKIAVLRLVAAFPVATKFYLRLEPVNSELEELLMSHSQFLRLQKLDNPPLEIASWIGTYIYDQYKRGNAVLHYSHVSLLQSNLKTMVESIGNCERIATTPLPIAYTIHLKHLLLIYCLLLPFQLIKDLGWWTGPVVALISFTILGIEEIGLEIENPFGHDYNDLPLDSICDIVKQEIADVIKWNDSVKLDVENIAEKS